jgi:hypothetical protein
MEAPASQALSDVILFGQGVRECLQNYICPSEMKSFLLARTQKGRDEKIVIVVGVGALFLFYYWNRL